jgi:hypothetical protein
MYNYTIIKNSFDLTIVTAIPGTTDRGTRNVILDAILHCRNENVPAFPSPERSSRNKER